MEIDTVNLILDFSNDLMKKTKQLYLSFHCGINFHHKICKPVCFHALKTRNKSIITENKTMWAAYKTLLGV